MNIDPMKVFAIEVAAGLAEQVEGSDQMFELADKIYEYVYVKEEVEDNVTGFNPKVVQ